MQTQEWFTFPRQAITVQAYFELNDIKHRLTVAKVTPAIAKDLLEFNIQNRPFQPNQIDRLKSAMLDDDYDFNGSSLVISNPLRLLDGQNRLRALIETNTTQYMLFVEGVPESVGDSLDQNVRRTVNHVLSRRGIKPSYKGVISSAATMLLQATGRYHSPMQVADFVEGQLDFLLPIAAWAKAMHAESPISEVRDRKNGRALSPGPLTALTAWVIQEEANYDLWSKFIVGVATGMSSNERDKQAFKAMRKRLISAPLFGTGGSGKSYVLMQFGVLIHTYNRWARGETIQVVKDYTQKRPTTLAELPKPSTATTVRDHPTPAPKEEGQVDGSADDIEDMSQGVELLDLRAIFSRYQEGAQTT